MPPDLRLEDEVHAALERDPRISNPADVAVSAQHGTVTLRGTVPSFKQRRAAVEAAKSVHEVEDVVDELKVRLLGDDRGDDEIRGAALQALIRDARVPADSIDVQVTDGWVTLKGEVHHQFESDAAFEDVANLEGVGGITNQIRVVSA